MFKAVLVLGLMMSSISYGSISVSTLHCGSLETPNGQRKIGLVHYIQVSYGDVPTSVALISKVLSPTATPLKEYLSFVSKDKQGNITLAGKDSTVKLKRDFTQALLTKPQGKALCQ